MTAPVMTQEAGGDAAAAAPAAAAAAAADAPPGWSGTVQFPLPSEHGLDPAALPRPDDPRVRLRLVPARALAALRWRGAQPDAARVAAAEAAVRRALAVAGVSPVDPRRRHLWQYDPPFSPPYMRENEVLVEVDPSTLPAGARAAWEAAGGAG